MTRPIVLAPFVIFIMATALVIGCDQGLDVWRVSP